MNSAVFRFGTFLVLSVAFIGSSSGQGTLEFTRVPAGSTWYYYTHENSPGTNWHRINYHQSGWPTGPAQLGYGDGDEQTVTTTQPAPPPVTTYFRHLFLAPTNLPITKVRLLRDDGAVVYLNGREILRDNMPVGPIEHSTLASSTTDDENAWREFSIMPVALLETTNVVAVEVHQSNPASSDLSFDLQLIAGSPQPPVRPLVGIQRVWDTSEPLPNALVTPGRFDITRWERDLSQPLRVHFAYEGTASAADYHALPGSLVIAPGHTTTSIVVFAQSDELVEGTETVIARIVHSDALDPSPANRPYDIDASHSRGQVLIHDEDSATPPAVRIETIFSAHEPRPNEDVRPGFFRIVRDGDRATQLTVMLRYEGTATPNVDYDPLPETATILAHERYVDVLVHARDDGVVESPETVVAHLIPPQGGGRPGYTIDPGAGSGTLYIIDNGLHVSASLRITQPVNGEFIRLGEPIQITAVATDPAGHISRVEFFANNSPIGRSEIVFVTPPQPGTPIAHSMVWSNAPAGEHVLDALAWDSNGAIVASQEVRIFVGTNQPQPFVSVRTIDDTAREPSANFNLADEAAFQISRSVGIQNDLRVFFSMHGTATEGIDYEPVGDSVVIPAGQVSVTVKISARADALTVVESLETVGLRIEPAPNLGPVPWYEIAPGLGEAGAVILERWDVPGVAYVFPDQNEHFEVNERTTLLVAAHQPSNRVTHVEFLLDGVPIGISELPITEQWQGVFLHRLPWIATPAGEHQLTARAILPDRPPVTSQSVRIVVGPEPNLPVVGVRYAPSLTTEPVPNADYAPGMFEFTRTGPTNEFLTVLFNVGGGATPGVDYHFFGHGITFAPGERTTNIIVQAIDDLLPETNETVLVTLGYGPLSTEPVVQPRYLIDPQHASAAVIIYDNDRTNAQARLEITRPQNGQVFPVGTRIEVDAVAVDPNGYIPRVEFFANGSRIGVSEIAFVVAPAPGTPITHSITWSNAPAGEHHLIARARDSLGNPVSSPEVRILVTNDTPRVFVSVTARDPVATEMPITSSAIDPATFELTRSGGTNLELVVFFSLHGTADEGIDYRSVGTRAVFPRGHSVVRVTIEPISDGSPIQEDMETVGIRLHPSADTRPIPIYEITPNQGIAGAVIFDGGPSTNRANMAFVFPDENARFDLGEEVTLMVAAYHQSLDITHVDFLLDGEKIGTSDVIVPPDNPGGLVFHRLRWNATPTGQHQLKAHGSSPSGLVMETLPLPILIAGDPNIPLVSVRTLRRSSLEGVTDDRELASFEFARNGPTNESLTLFFQVSGTATEGLDYRPLSNRVVFPRARATVIVPVRPIDDSLVELEETVQVQLNHSPGYTVSIQNDRALVTILDNDPTNTQARIEITRPEDTEVFSLGTPIRIDAVATDPNGYVGRVEFFAGDRLIGVSHVDFVQAPQPGTPVHHSMVWSNAPAGEHVLTAWTADTRGGRIQSAPVRITVRSSGTNEPPRVSFHTPRDGAVFEPGQPIPIGATAIDPNGIRQFDLFAGDRLLWRTNGPALGFTWVNAPAGQHTLRAIAVDNLGARGDASIRVLVRESSSSFVERDLPESYVPGTAFTVRLLANPPAGTRAWGVEDQPPRGWTVSAISHEGVYDPATGKVKFGHFTDVQRRTLTYRLTPPSTASGNHEFAGTASADGRSFEITGDRVIRGTVQEHHPADTNRDKRIVLVELTAYAAAWRNNNARTNPIPASYVTRAALIWRNGEAYHFVPTSPAPLCWVPDAAPVRGFAAATTSSAVRSLALATVSGTEVTVGVQQLASASGYAVEERLPAGWTAASISHEGVFDAAAGVIRWGLFLDGNARSLSYTLVPPAGVTAIGDLRGEISVDGNQETVSGEDRILSAATSAALTLTRCERQADGTLQLQLAGAAGQICVLEGSTDLQSWTVVGEVFLPDGQLTFSDDASGGSQRFYRLRVR